MLDKPVLEDRSLPSREVLLLAILNHSSIFHFGTREWLIVLAKINFFIEFDFDCLACASDILLILDNVPHVWIGHALLPFSKKGVVFLFFRYLNKKINVKNLPIYYPKTTGLKNLKKSDLKGADITRNISGSLVVTLAVFKFGYLAIFDYSGIKFMIYFLSMVLGLSKKSSPTMILFGSKKSCISKNKKTYINKVLNFRLGLNFVGELNLNGLLRNLLGISIGCKCLLVLIHFIYFLFNNWYKIWIKKPI